MSDKEYIKQLENTIESLQHQISNLTEMVNLLTKKQFGSSSEKTKKEDGDGQISLFNEAEIETSEKAVEPDRKTVVNGYNRGVKKKGYKEELIKDLEVIEIPCELPSDEMNCPWCNTQLIPIGKETVRDELQFIPAQVKIIRYVRYAYECPSCKKDGTPVIEKALTPSPVMKHSLASPSSVANVMYLKYVNAVPLYRQEQEWERYGIKLSRATLANWIIRCSTDWFTPIIDHLKVELLKKEILHADETTVQVLNEPDKKASTKSYMWLYRSGKDDKHPIVLFEYKPSRGGKNAAEYLKGFHGYLHTDGYAGYEKVEDIIRCGCWAHLRRYFVEAMPVGSNKDKSISNGEIGRDYCNKLFEIEDQLGELSYEDRKSERLRLEKPVLEAFWCWLQTLNPLKGSRLGKAVTYAQNQKPYMENYLLDGRCSISNNLAENSIRPFTTGRKNWMFSSSMQGATASAAVYSIVETAKANNLDVYNYLQHLLLYMPDIDYKNYPEDLENLMPWSKEIQRLYKK
jgi:transposase